MSTEVKTGLIFGYVVSLNESQYESLEDTNYELFPAGNTKDENFYLYGYKLIETNSIEEIGEVNLSLIDFGKEEEAIQDALKLVNVPVKGRASVLLTNYYW